MLLPTLRLRPSILAWLCCLGLCLYTTTVRAQAPRPGGGGSDSTQTQQSGLVPVPASFQLHPGYPNPFNPSVHLRFTLLTAAQVQLEVYNLLGQRVQTLANGWRDAGVHEVRWDARTSRGRELPSGVYLVRLEVGAAAQLQRVVLQR